jgi:hypothetical protein
VWCPSHVQPSQPEDIPGEDKHLASRVRGAAEGALQAFAPVRGIHQHVRSSCHASYASESHMVWSSCCLAGLWSLRAVRRVAAAQLDKLLYAVSLILSAIRILCR